MPSEFRSEGPRPSTIFCFALIHYAWIMLENEKCKLECNLLSYSFVPGFLEKSLFLVLGNIIV